MPSYAKDPRCTAMADALIHLLRRACPQDAGGYGGYYQVDFGDEEAIALGGVELIRAAMRKAAKQLRWKVTTIGWTGTRNGTVIAVQDTREVPDGFRARRGDERQAERGAPQGLGRTGPGAVQRGSVPLMTQESRAAVARDDA
ncbi:hypothetical protein ABTZ58_38975 [Streptomyces sp. NPDC094143]|uniref:hypothetical protein n=1 Tax=Streptomyces sp. NPDC094143 TaxID=3155310 RepID=UPI003324ABD4